MKAHIQTVALVHIKDKKVLLVLCKGKNAFYMPGGKLDQGEDEIQALIRESKEELSIDVVPETVKHYGTFQAQAYGKPEGVIVSTICYHADIKGKPKPTSEVEKVRFFSHGEYIAMEETAPLLHVILKDLKEKGHIT